MLFWTIVKVALKSLLANKTRSFLAVLGIIIGVTAVISMLAVGAGAQQQIVDRVNSMGSNMLSVRPNWRPAAGARGGSMEHLTLDDLEAILNVPGVSMVAPLVYGNAQLKYYSKNTPTTILGTALTYASIANMELTHGRFFSEGETERMAHVVVLGPVTATALFGEGVNPVDEVIKINGADYKVVGVLKPKGSMGRWNPDDRAIIPYTTAMDKLLGITDLHEVNINVEKLDEMNNVEDQVLAMLYRRYRIPTDDEAEHYHVHNQSELIETASSVSRTFAILLGTVASISLLVGGIGIMNIMLVTVTERTREIGIRKAIGAKRGDILIQFLLEALIMSCLGGLFGVLLGIGSAWIIGRMTNYITLTQPSSVILALSVSMAVGIFFGYYPAHRAARLAPIDALRYE